MTHEELLAAADEHIVWAVNAAQAGYAADATAHSAIAQAYTARAGAVLLAEMLRLSTPPPDTAAGTAREESQA